MSVSLVSPVRLNEAKPRFHFKPGKRCETIICQNGGKAAGATCVCPTGFTGLVTCGYEREMLYPSLGIRCETITCQNGGKSAGSSCVCPTGFSGRISIKVLKRLNAFQARDAKPLSAKTAGKALDLAVSVQLDSLVKQS